MGSISGTGAAQSAYSTPADGFLTPERVNVLTAQATGGSAPAQAAAKEALRPHIEDSMQQYMKSHPGASAQDFMAALDRGAVSASDMGLYGRGTDAAAVAEGKQLASVLRSDPAYASSFGVDASK